MARRDHERCRRFSEYRLRFYPYRNNTRAVRASAYQQVVNSFAAISFDIAKDKNLVHLYLRPGETSLRSVSWKVPSTASCC